MTGKLIYYVLSRTVALTAYVSDRRITPVRRLQESDLPAITYEKISTVPTDTKDGVSHIDTERWTIHVWSKTYTQCATIAGLVRTALDRYQYLTDTGSLGVIVDKFVYQDENDLYEDWVNVHHKAIDFKVRVKR